VCYLSAPIKILALFALLGVPLAGCEDENNPTGDSPSDVVFPVRDVKYNAQVQVLFNQACNFSGCHGEGAHESPLKLTTWANTVITTPGVVVPGNPGSSTLVLRIEGQQPIMPPSGARLNQNQIDGIRTWIAEGAPNN
jgi:mono/diheme cytochrome c family protein